MANAKRIFVNSLVTAVGAETYTQAKLHDDFRARVSRLPGADTVLEKVKSVFDNSAVDTRHLEISIEELDRKRGSSGWHPIAREAIVSLGKRALEKALAQGTKASECDALVVVASNYDGFPGPSRRLAEAAGFRPDALFFDLASLGCGGANHGIKLAHMLLETGTCKTVCLVCVDILGTHIQMRQYSALPSISEIVARVLPSDGAAAFVFSTEAGANPLFSFAGCDLKLHSWSESNEYMMATSSADGEPFGSIGKDIRTRILDESATLLRPEILDEPMFIHGGGTGLLRRVAEAFPKLGPTAELSASVLQEHGNMSAPTVLFVLAKALEQKIPVAPRTRILSFGPGVYTSLLTLDEVRRD